VAEYTFHKKGCQALTAEGLIDKNITQITDGGQIGYDPRKSDLFLILIKTEANGILNGMPEYIHWNAGSPVRMIRQEIMNIMEVQKFLFIRHPEFILCPIHVFFNEVNAKFAP
jgi:hypothetical protein